MSEHTPGPWRVTYIKGWDGVTSERDGDICKLIYNNPENARLIAAAPNLLEACKKALFDSSLDRSETVLSAEVHEALNNAIIAAEEDCKPAKSGKKRVPSPPLGPRSWCFGQGPAETENGYWDDACDNCECIDRCYAISKAEKGA